MFYSPQDLTKFNDVSFKYLKTRHDGNSFTITLNRPEKRNAFTPGMVDEITFALEYANRNNDVWCINLDAEGPVFCAGMDLLVFHNPDLDERSSSLPIPVKEANLGEAFNELRKPAIAKVLGDVLAGGFLIIAGCTFVVSSSAACYCLPEVKRGIFPMQVMASLMQIMPKRKVIELCILGKNYTAEEALSLGLVTHLADPEHIHRTCETLCTTILSNSPFAIQKGMDALNTLLNHPPANQYTYLLEQLKQIRGSEDAREGIEAFKERRMARWQNK